MRWLLLALLVGATACHHRIARVPVTQRADDHAFVDLKPGGRLRIIVPFTRSGSYVLQGATMALQANDLLGYRTTVYEVLHSRAGRIKLRFVSAEESRDGKSTTLSSPPELPFHLPQKPAFMRLVFFIRESRADHNMAIVSAHRLETVEAFTAALKNNPAVCGTSPQVTCEWVPQGVAVRPESGS